MSFLFQNFSRLFLRRWRVVFALAALVLIAGVHCGPDPVAATGGSEVWGMLVDSDSAAVSGATVIIDTGDSAGWVDSTYVIISDSTGFFGIDGLAPGTYDLYADFGDGQLVAFRQGVQKLSNDTLRFGTIVMREPGAIAGKVNVRRGKLSAIDVFIPQTAYSTLTDDSGEFTLTTLPPNAFSFIISAPDHFDFTFDTTIISGDTIDLGLIELTYDTALAPLATGAVTAVYDTANAVVFLQWNRVDVADVAGYVIYRNVDSAGLHAVDTVVDTLFADTLFRRNGDSVSNSLSYQLKSIDNQNNLSLIYSPPVSVPAPPPSILATRITWLPADTVTSTLNPVDSVIVVIAYENQVRTNREITWSVGHVDSVKKQDSLSNRTGHDTLTVAWNQDSVFDVYVRIVDQAGGVWQSSHVVSVVRSAPKETVVALPDMPTPRRFLASAVLDKKLYAIGGEKDKSYGSGWPPLVLNTVERFDIVTGKWDSVAAMNYARADFAADTLNGTIYVIGGQDYRREITSIERYDPISDSWEIDSVELPGARIGHTVTALDNKLYIIGGIVPDTVYGLVKVTAVVGAFDPVAGTLEHVAKLSTQRAYHQAVAAQGKIYAMGGIGNSDQIELSTVVADISLFNPLTGEVRTVSTISAKRTNFASCAVNDNIYLIDGFGYDSTLDVLNSIQSFNSLSYTWNPVSTRLTHNRQCSAAEAILGGIYVVGGTENDYSGSLGQSGKLEVYYP
ncbi:MAG: hypothetical protein GF398_05035 [Chitinivibrionales bacterium]|nr:hypothetical protein [Chitinivibrionales bacterium]